MDLIEDGGKKQLPSSWLLSVRSSVRPSAPVCYSENHRTISVKFHVWIFFKVLTYTELVKNNKIQ